MAACVVYGSQYGVYDLGVPIPRIYIAGLLEKDGRLACVGVDEADMFSGMWKVFLKLFEAGVTKPRIRGTEKPDRPG